MIDLPREPQIWIGETGSIKVSPDLSYDCARWGLTISGRTRTDALKYLWQQAKLAKSDGIDCSYVGLLDIYGEPVTGTCMCGRLLMLLHDVDQDEITREKFEFVMQMMEKEFGDHTARELWERSDGSQCREGELPQTEQLAQ